MVHVLSVVWMICFVFSSYYIDCLSGRGLYLVRYFMDLMSLALAIVITLTQVFSAATLNVRHGHDDVCYVGHWWHGCKCNNKNSLPGSRTQLSRVGF